MIHNLRLASDWRVLVCPSFRLSFLLLAALATRASAQTIPVDDFNDDDGIPNGWTTLDTTLGRPYAFDDRPFPGPARVSATSMFDPTPRGLT